MLRKIAAMKRTQTEEAHAGSQRVANKPDGIGDAVEANRDKTHLTQFQNRHFIQPYIFPKHFTIYHTRQLQFPTFSQHQEPTTRNDNSGPDVELDGGSSTALPVHSSTDRSPSPVANPSNLCTKPHLPFPTRKPGNCWNTATS